jgi:aspartate/methionine/tyrosine aminotransferase
LPPLQTIGAPLRATEGLFAASTYAEWVRGAMRLRASRPDVSLLFESTIAEPTEALMSTVHEAFAGEAPSRFVSVFADGNRFAVAALARRYGLEPEQILTTTGATSALTLALKALVTLGDHVLVERPGFDLLARLATEAGARVDPLPRPAPNHWIDPEDLAKRLTPRTRAVMITNLHNPSGAWLPPDEVSRLAKVCDGVGAVLMVDEVYADFVGPTPQRPAARLGRNVLTASSLTKVFGLFALKFGWLAGDAALMSRIRRGVPDGDLGVSKLAHAVAAHVLETPEPYEAHWRAVLAAGRPVAARWMSALQGEGLLKGEVPLHGCMAFPEVPGARSTRDLTARLLDDFGVLVAPGEYFGSPGYVRVGFGGSADQLDQGFGRLRMGLATLLR